MADIKDALVYICHQYPNKLNLSLARLTQIVYLADWRSSIVRSHTLTPTKWFMNESGIHAPEINALVKSDPLFSVVISRTVFRTVSERVSVKPSAGWKSLSKEDKQILDFVIRTSASKYFNDFLRLIESTYPFYSSPAKDIGGPLDLKNLANEYTQGVVANA